MKKLSVFAVLLMFCGCTGLQTDPYLYVREAVVFQSTEFMEYVKEDADLNEIQKGELITEAQLLIDTVNEGAVTPVTHDLESAEAIPR